ncbi:HAMP domain-containing sensor histidine kinase [Desmospora activa]|uniref:histidine kinase n=1 Tax=Desmospora activa DSM 45169 TaxID=1121389 RepID=A0A2T4ZBW5_9BACL|nr:HAMP domain-containing sensor histidine kinase [Desmospora activa]PTM59378.1 signal transduction histidine kinase [Desmospora activa DSM 45169]
MRKSFRLFWNWIVSSLRIQMIGFVVISLLVAIIAPYSFFLLGIGVTEKNRYYYPSQQEVQRELMLIKKRNLVSEPLNKKKRKLLDRYSHDNSLSLALTDEQGKVLLHTRTLSAEPIDIHSFLQRMETQTEDPSDHPEKREIVTVYPFAADGKKRYLFGVKTAEGQATTYRIGNPVLTVPAAILTFLFTYLWLTRRKLNQIRELAHGMDRFAKGDLSFRLHEKGRDELASLSSNINRMAERLESAWEREQAWKRQRLELISNVSHDLRSPLTSIIGYLQLMKDKPNLERAELLAYGGIALNKSRGLQRRIEDLFEYAKLTHPDVRLRKESISLTHLLEQLLDEASPLMTEREIRLERELPKDSLLLDGDPSLLARLFENLLDNAIRYGKDGWIRIQAVPEGKMARITLTNPVKELDPELVSRLFDTFVTGDASRTGEGSGLGLAIAKNVTKLHGGEIRADYAKGEICFTVWLPLHHDLT